MLASGRTVSAAALLACLLLTACQRAPDDPAACEVPVPNQPTRVTVISYESHGMPFFGDQMAKCSRGRQLVVRHQMLPYDELVNQATIGMSSRSASPYHIIHVYDQLLVEWASKGWLAPLDDLVQKYRASYQLDQVPPALWEMMKVNGHIYAVPAIQNPEIFFYRRDVFDRYGLLPPKTYDDLMSLCVSLKSRGMPYPLLMMFSRSSDHIAYEFHDLLHAMGGKWFNDDGSPAFNDVSGQTALQKMIALYQNCVHPDAVDFTPEDAAISLEQGQSMMAIFWLNEAPQVEDPAVSKFAGKFGFSPPPSATVGGPPASYWAQDSWVIPANVRIDKELLFRIALEGTKSQNQVKAASIALVTRTVDANLSHKAYFAAGITTIQRGAVGLARRPYTYLAQEAISRYAIEALLGHLPPREALDRAAADYERTFREEGFGTTPAARASALPPHVSESGVSAAGRGS